MGSMGNEHFEVWSYLCWSSGALPSYLWDELACRKGKDVLCVGRGRLTLLVLIWIASTPKP